MVLIPQPKRRKVAHLLSYLVNEASRADRDLKEEGNPENKFSAAHIASRDTSAKKHVKNIVKAIRWLIDDLGVSIPDAYTDSEIDALGFDIREFDDGSETI